jgi:hypothetical protein
MRYILLYNERTGQFRIEEVGKTITSSPDDAEFLPIGGSNSLEELKCFVWFVRMFMPMFQTIKLQFGGFLYAQTHAAIKRVFDARNQTEDLPHQPSVPALVVRVFEDGDF